MTYTVTLRPTTEFDSGAFFMLQWHDPEAVAEFVEFDELGNEVWSVETERNIDSYLNTQPGVIEYTSD